MQQSLFNLSGDDGNRFESYYSGEDNRLIFSAIKLAIQSTDHQQILLWGEPSGGKTHLLQGACYAAVEQGAKATYLPLKKILDFGVSILEGLEGYSLICIDDIELVSGNPSWEVALFNLINHAHYQQQTLLFSSGCDPNEKNYLLADLKSRLLWGMVHKIEVLNETECFHAFKQRASLRGMNFDKVLIDYIKKRYTHNIKELINILNKLDEASLVTHRVITRALIKQVLKE
ncbi:MAG: DnaA regulatory inactivator Hda [Thiotrichaceae bacterium]|nr:DnaA regulatory inactivator Hda [Thiotrichaceae bacterium]